MIYYIDKRDSESKNIISNIKTGDIVYMNLERFGVFYFFDGLHSIELDDFHRYYLENEIAYEFVLENIKNININLLRNNTQINWKEEQLESLELIQEMMR